MHQNIIIIVDRQIDSKELATGKVTGFIILERTSLTTKSIIHKEL